MKLVFQSGPRTGQEIDVKPGETIRFGREAGVEVVLDDPRVSRPHAQMRVDADGNAWIEDLSSTNGTLVNGQKIERPTNLRIGDTLGIGNTRFSVGGKAAQKTIVAGQTEVVSAGAVGAGAAAAGAAGAVPKPQSSTGMTMIRQNVASANRRAAIAIATMVVVIAVAVIGGGYYLATRPMSNDDLIALMKPSVLNVAVSTSFGNFRGTGWVLDVDRGLIVTNGHVVAGGRTFQVSAEGLTPRTATLVAAAPCDDIAIVHVDEKAGLKSVKVGSQATVKQGDDVLAFGYPGTASATPVLVFESGNVSVARGPVLEGHISHLQSMPNMILHSAKINHGNSGGPLVNRKGEVVGMNTLGNDVTDQNYAIGIDRITDLKDQLAAGKGLGFNGLAVDNPTIKDIADAGYDPTKWGYDALAGSYVQKAAITSGANVGTAADRAGLDAKRFLITAVNGQAVTDQFDYCEWTRGGQAPNASDITIAFPSGETQTLKVPYQ